ncbi:hypothetical protein [Shinella sp.]|jgi:uncharacterized membrane protein|uniref:hypothetical protein n=1 Tax=Shinella sp. TaxID=1870904 RepID=UPI003D2B7D1F
MKTIMNAYLATGIAFLIVDAIWLSMMADMLYRPLSGDKPGAAVSSGAGRCLLFDLRCRHRIFFAVMPAPDGAGSAMPGGYPGNVDFRSSGGT